MLGKDQPLLFNDVNVIKQAKGQCLGLSVCDIDSVSVLHCVQTWPKRYLWFGFFLVFVEVELI